MAFVPTQSVSILHAPALIDSARHAVEGLRAWTHLTPQQRAERYVARMPVAVVAG